MPRAKVCGHCFNCQLIASSGHKKCCLTSVEDRNHKENKVKVRYVPVTWGSHSKPKGWEGAKGAMTGEELVTALRVEECGLMVWLPSPQKPTHRHGVYFWPFGWSDDGFVGRLAMTSDGQQLCTWLGGSGLDARCQLVTGDPNTSQPTNTVFEWGVCPNVPSLIEVEIAEQHRQQPVNTSYHPENLRLAFVFEFTPFSEDMQQRITARLEDAWKGMEATHFVAHTPPDAAQRCRRHWWMACDGVRNLTASVLESVGDGYTTRHQLEQTLQLHLQLVPAVFRLEQAKTFGTDGAMLQINHPNQASPPSSHRVLEWEEMLHNCVVAMQHQGTPMVDEKMVSEWRNCHFVPSGVRFQNDP